MNKNIKFINSQIELIKTLAKGYTIQECAIIMGKNYYDIQKRIQLLHSKLNVNNRKELIKKAIKLEIIKTVDISKRFRKRFFKIKKNKLLPINKVLKTSIELSNIEIEFLKLYSKGYSMSKIGKILGLKGQYHINCINYNICNSIGVANLKIATIFAYKLNILK